MELVGDDERCVALTGLLPLRLLAERAGLTAGISAAMRRPGYDPDYDRGQVLLDLGLIQLAGGQVAWLDARHRSHVHVEDDVKQAKAIGMNRWPWRYWKVNVAWIAVVAMAASLLAAFRHLGLPPGDLRKASVKTLRFRFFEIPGRITHGQRKTWPHLPAGWPWTPDLTTAWQTIKSLPIPI